MRLLILSVLLVLVVMSTGCIGDSADVIENESHAEQETDEIVNEIDGIKEIINDIDNSLG